MTFYLNPASPWQAKSHRHGNSICIVALRYSFGALLVSVSRLHCIARIGRVCSRHWNVVGLVSELPSEHSDPSLPAPAPDHDVL